jgi:hypothetical protein
MDDWNQVICIDNWQPDETAYENGYYPEGTRDKTVYFSPDSIGHLPFKPNHRYLFKKSRKGMPWQFWMEIIAYRIGQIMNVAVPPAFVGLSTRENPEKRVYGALIKWFYITPPDSFISGKIIGSDIPNFDYKTGAQHNLQTILTKRFGVYPQMHQYMLHAFAKILTFDAVIGNTDRHQENWGFVIRPASEKDKSKVKIHVRLSPAFDNGTSMLHEQVEKNFYKFENETYCLNYLNNGKHHMKWSLEEPKDMNFFEFMVRYVREYPETREDILIRLNFTENELRKRLFPLTQITVDEECRLTQSRLDLILSMTMKRKELLKQAIGI